MIAALRFASRGRRRAEVCTELVRRGSVLADQGRHEQALTLLTAAAAGYRRLFWTGRWRYTVAYQSTVAETARQVAALGRLTAALDRLAGPLGYFEAMARFQPRAYRATYAVLLLDAARWRRGLGHTTQALADAERATALCRDERGSGSTWSDAFLADCLEEVGRLHYLRSNVVEALRAAEEAALLRGPARCQGVIDGEPAGGRGRRPGRS